MIKLTLNIEPKPQSRPRFAMRGGFTKAYEDKEMRSWRKHCRLLIANLYKGKEPLEGTIRARVRFYIQPPQYIAKVKKNQQLLADEIMPVGKKPDLDNFIKSLFDSANDLLFKDDGQIAEMHAKKLYSLNPRIELELEEIQCS